MIASPYPGLRAFDRDEDLIFFGREEHTAELLDKLSQTHFVAVLGTSGSGKSSLVRAGLVPALERGAIAHAGPSWQIATFRPGERPVARLAEALIEQTGWGASFRDGGERDGELSELIRRGPMALNWLLGVQPLPEGTRLLLVVDQFEEIFRFRSELDPVEARAFVDGLLAASADGDVYVVITMRSDFLGDCSGYPGLPEAVNAGLYLTPRLSTEQMADAIVLPARVFGGEIEPELVRQLLAEARGQSDQLPLLQHALMRFWQRDEDKRLTATEYQALGDLKSILDDHAEEVYGGLDEAGRRVAEVLFRSLTEHGRDGRYLRRPSRVFEIAQLAGVGADEVVAVVDEFRAGGRSFLVPPVPQPLTADSVVDITHEALIRQWERLRRWANEEANEAEIYTRLCDAAARHRQGTGALWSEADLSIALDWRDRLSPSPTWAARYGGDLSQALAFLAESEAARDRFQAERERQRRRELRLARSTALATTLGLVVSVALGLFAWTNLNASRRHLEDSKRAAESSLASERRARSQEELALDERDRATAAQHRAEYAQNQLDSIDRLNLQLIAYLEFLPDAQRNLRSNYQRRLDLIDSVLSDEAGGLDDESSPLRDRWQWRRAETLRQIAQTELNLRRADDAETLLEQALEELQTLTATSPDDPERRHEEALIQMRLGQVHGEQGRVAEALGRLRRARAIVDDLVENPPGELVFDRDILLPYFEISDLLSARGRPRDALRSLEIADSRARSLARLEPSSPHWPRFSAWSHLKRGSLQAELGRRGVAEENYRTAHEIMTRLASSEPLHPRFQRDLAVSHLFTASIASEEGSSESALASTLEARWMLERLAALDPENTRRQRDLADVLIRVASLQLERDEVNAALQGYREALEITERCAAQDPGDAYTQREMALLHLYIGDAEQKRGEDLAALSGYEASSEIADQLFELDPGNATWKRDRAVAYSRIGDVYKQRREYAVALEYYRKNLEITQQLVQHSPDNTGWQRDLAIAHERIGSVQGKDDSESAERLASYREEVRILAALVEGDGENPNLWEHYLGALSRVADAHETRGELTEALAAHLQVRNSARAAREKNSDDSRWQATLDRHRLRIESILRRLRLGLLADAIPVGPAEGGSPSWRAETTDRYEPLVEGGWEEIDSLAMLDGDSRVAAILDEHDVRERFVGARSLRLPFYEDAVLYEVLTLAPEGPVGALTFVVHGETTSLLEGRSTPIHEMNATLGLRLDTPAQAEAYLRYFCAAVHGDEGPFRIVDRSGDVPWIGEAVPDPGIQALEIEPDGAGEWDATATVLYSNALFRARFHVPKGGVVEMLDDEPQLADLSVTRSFFVGPIRYTASFEGDWLDAMRAKAQERGDRGLAKTLRAVQVDQAREDGDAGSDLAGELGSLAFEAILAGDPGLALEASEEAVALAPDEVWLFTNLAHAHLMLDEHDRAEAIYLKYRDRPLNGYPTFSAAVIDEFRQMREAGIAHPEMERIEKLLAR